MFPWRTATAEDIDALYATLAAAFASEVGWGYMREPGNVEGMRAFARALLIPKVRRGTVWVTDDRLSLAIWQQRTTDPSPDEDYASVWAVCRAEIGDANGWGRWLDWAGPDPLVRARRMTGTWWPDSAAPSGSKPCLS
jgi:hypothetical protein